MNDYQQFLASKRKTAEPRGHAINDSAINSRLFDWQRRVVSWAVRCGSAALFEDCGLGKTVQQLEWASHVVRKTNKPVLVLCPIAVGPQTLREVEKFGINCEAKIVTSGLGVAPGINICNYEKLHLLDTSMFGGVVLDESSILKAYTGKIKQALCQAFANTPYKLACTATPAPNDRMEIGNHSEFLGAMPSAEMLAVWFLNDTMKAGGYRLRKHAQNDFWNWVASWAVCISKPSDLGFSDEGYKLPPLNIHEHVVAASKAPSGFLFHPGGPVAATKVHGEKRASLDDRAEVVGKLVCGPEGKGEAWAVWCDTDYEADALKAVIPDCVEVRGSHAEKTKEERLSAFSSGQARVIITKSEIGGYGLNWQHCANTTWFAGYSFERFYQAIRRLYRFGQKRSVNVHTVMSEAEQSIADVVKRKAAEHQEMFCEMALQMKAGMLERVCGVRQLRPYVATQVAKLPAWIKRKESVA